MILSNKDAKELIKHPTCSVHLSRAKFQESRLRFHAQVAEQELYASSYRMRYREWVDSVITASDKRVQFEKMLTYPLKSNEVVDSIADEYAKVFNSQNSYIGFDFTDSALTQEYEEYSKGYEHFWRKDVFSAMLTAINSIVVIDMSPEEDSKPYYYLLSIDRVIDVRCDKDGVIEYLIFRDGERIVCIDENSYKVFTKRGEDYVFKFSNPHDLGYAPAAFMWNDTLSNDNPYIKQSPISAILGDLDWYLFQVTAKRCLDIYAAYPIYWSFKDKCKVAECTGGWIKNPEVTVATGEYGYRRCPSCEKNSIVAPGSHLGIDPPRSSDAPNLREPAGIISVDRQSLDFNVEETDRLKNEIIKTATGKLDEKSRTTGPINEDQVHSNYESQTNILMWIAGNFEKIHKFVIDTTAKLMYQDRYVGCTVSYGTDFYLQDQATVTTEYQEAVDAGLPMYILQAKRNQVDELQSKNNPNERQRIYILRQLEPYQDISFATLQQMQGIDQNKFAIKLNFSTFVNRFELEHGNIVEWGSKLEFKTKIERINQEFEKYVKESTPEPVQ